MCSRILRVDYRKLSINSSNTSAVHEQRSCHSSSVDSTSFFKPSTYLHRVSQKPDPCYTISNKSTKSGPMSARLWKKSNRIAVTARDTEKMRNRSDFNLNTKYVLSTRSLSNATFSFLITWRSSSSKSAAVYKISWKSDDFSQRYGDITIFKMAAVRHLGTVLPPYETTHEISVAGRSCLSNFMSIWYRSEFFAYLTWNSYSGPQNGGFGDFEP